MINVGEILEYPFDCEMILRKQRAIRRQLLMKNDQQYTKTRIAILSGSTTVEIKNVLEIFLLHFGIQAEFYESTYNKYYEESVFPNEALNKFQPEIIFIFVSYVNLLYKPDLEDNEAVVQQKIYDEYQRYQTIWDSLTKKYNAIIIQNNIELPCYVSNRNMDRSMFQGIQSFVAAINNKIAEYANENLNFYIHDINFLSAQIGLKKWHNRTQYYLYKIAIDYDVMPLVSHSMATLIKSILGKNKKCLILDLDNTLWGGVIGEEGLDGLALGNETPQGEAYIEFQQYVLNLKKQGIILAICSKNDECIAKQGFEHPDSILKIEDFVCIKANWNLKNLNIQMIANELNIGLDSMVFIDDNPVERQLIKNTLPEVSVPEVDADNPYSYIQAIEENGYFSISTLSTDDLNRNKAYMENKKRIESKKKYQTYGDFLQSLNMQAEISAFKNVYFDRITQLINKSNQFNLTSQRYTLADIKRIANSDQYIAIYGRLTDKFGDNGLVSIIIGEKKGDELHIILWLMSCRVLKRDMEYAMLDALVEKGERLGVKKIIGYYYKTLKNRIVENLYEEIGFSLLAKNGENSIWEMGLINNYEKKNKFIKLRREEDE